MAREGEPEPIEVDPDSLLPSCPKVQSSVYWPGPIDHRLNQLVDLAARTGERLSKADLLGALVKYASADGEELGRLVRAYRRSTAGEVVLRVNPDDVIVLHERRPGRRQAPSH
jgi:hypothetical protein